MLQSHAAPGSDVPLSVVVAATHASDTLPSLRERLQPELDQLGGELIVVDGSADGLPEGQSTARLPGTDVFALRAAGARLASGKVVAFTEDHCLPEPGWCKAILDAHARNREAEAVAGSVTNGATESLMSWANFLMVFASFLPPTPSHRRTPPIANVSLTRRVLRAHDLVPGHLELELLPHLWRGGHVALSREMRVSHIQPRGMDAVMHHFHNGRSTAGLPHRRPPWHEVARRVARSAVLPWRLLAQVAAEIRARPKFMGVGLRAAPLMVLLAHAHAAGEALGIVLGPGRSPSDLE